MRGKYEVGGTVIAPAYVLIVTWHFSFAQQPPGKQG